MQSTPALPLFKRILSNVSAKRQRLFYQAFLFGITFIAYVSYHVNKRPFGDVKSVLSPDCNVTIEKNDTCHPWSPFKGNKKDKGVLGLLDFTFMIAYSVSLFISGYFAERINLRIFLTSGMFLTVLSSLTFGFGFYLDVHNISFFFIAQMLTGITQSTGLPAITEAIGEWLPPERIGLFYGIWSCSSPVGNIVGNSMTGELLKYGWGAPFLGSAAVIGCCGILIYVFLLTDPSEVNVCIENSDDSITNKAVSPTESNKEELEKSNINVIEAFLIPSVLDFAFCTFFVKLVHYTFFFWLPVILNNLLLIDASDSSYVTSYYDIGTCIGGIITGFIYDVTDKPAIISSVMLAASAPMIIVLFMHSAGIALYKFYIFLVGCLIGGPFLLMTSSLAKRLGDKYYGDSRTIAILTAILDGFGSFGAAVGPLLTGLIKSWRNVSYFLCACVLIAVLTLIRQCYFEIMEMIRTFQKRKDSNYYGELVGDESEALMKNEEK